MALPQSGHVQSKGQFADGTPITETSLQEWRSLPHQAKVAKNVENMNRHVVCWNQLIRVREREGVLRETPPAGQPNPLFDKALPYLDKTACTVVFMHIPKVGGTTLEYVLGKNYWVNRLIHINGPELEKKPQVLFKHDTHPSVIMGHHKSSSILYQLLSQPVLHVTLLRDPIRRIISYYDYLHTATYHAQYPKVSQLTLSEFVQSSEFVELENAQALRLIGQLRQQKDSSLSDNDVLKQAKQTLTRRMTLVGVTEDYTRFLIMLKRLLRLSDIFHIRQNISKQKTDLASVPDSVLQTIRDRNAVDLELYAYARDLFTDRCRQLDITQAHVDTFNHMNQNYQTLIATAAIAL